ncbi:MAG: hypothetical protein OXC12_14935 [Spirochaetaceae bacterium]|nr:hypothetical protein [Spirochaetaceae bacterium]
MSASIILLCEDQRTDQFVRRFLKHRNFRTHDIHTVPLPAKGSGEQWVREQYPEELQWVRRKKQTVLLVVTDADMNTTANRRSRLDRQCDTEEVRKRQPRDLVIIAIPRRNIETWLWHLKTGEVVNEVHDYKPRFRKLNTAGLHELADSLYRMCDREQSLLPTAPPSLKEACLEYATLTRFLR